MDASPRRRFPRPRDFGPLLRFSRPVLSSTRLRLEKALTIDDLRAVAKRRTPKAPFDYTDGERAGAAAAAAAGIRCDADRAIAILTAQVERTMRLVGVRSVAELNPDHVTQLKGLTHQPLATAFL